MADFTSDYAIAGGATDDFDCEAITGWTVDGTFATGLALNTQTVRQGSNSIDLDGTTGGEATWTHDINGVNDRFKVTETNLHFWLFYAKGKSATNAFTDNANTLGVRLYVGGTTQYLYYYLTENGDNDVPFGWSLWQVSGTNYNGGGELLTVTGTPTWAVGNTLTGQTSGETATVTRVLTTTTYLITHPTGSGFTASETISNGSSTATFSASPDVTADVQRVQLVINWNSNPNPALKMDFWFTGKNINVTSGTSSNPVTFTDIKNFSDSNSLGPLGVVEVSDVFVNLLCGVTVGADDSAVAGNTGWLADSAKNILFNQYSEEVKHDLNINRNSGAEFGILRQGTDGTYPLNGCQLVVPPDRYPNIDTREGGTLKIYDGVVLRWGICDFGDSSGDSSTTIDFSRVDFDTCENLKFNANNMFLKNLEVYNNPALINRQCGEFGAQPDSSVNILVHDCKQGFYFQTTMTIEEYFARDNDSADLGILEGQTLTILNGDFDPNKITRQT